MAHSDRKRRREKTARLFERCIAKVMTVPDKITVSEWAEKYRILNESSSMPGQWHNSVTPYLTEIMDCFCDPYIHHINFVKSTQVGGTEAMINATGWIITQDPSPTMIVYPTDDLAKNISNDKLRPAYRSTPEISERFYKGNSNEVNLRFRGMNIYLRSGGSPSKLASLAIKYLFFDEIDKMPGAAKNEASPYNLAAERTKTFTHSRKIYTCSTPTHKGNYVWRLHERADEQREYFVPCPHCGEMITLKWEQVKFAEDPEGEMTISQRAATAKYICQECGAVITDSDKRDIIRRGEWRDTKGLNEGKCESVSFHINALYSFFVTWKMAAEQFLETKDDPEERQNFINSWLAEPFEDEKYSIKPDKVMEKRAPEGEGVVPDWARFLTAGVDVQRRSVYFDIVAWGANWTSQSIMHRQVVELEDIDIFMTQVYKNKNGEEFPVLRVLVDSGDQTDTVYDFCATREWAIACKGVARSISHYRISQINRIGKYYNGQTLILVDGGRYKDLISARLLYPPGEGAAMVHADTREDYARQLTAEHKVAVGKGANRRMVWALKSLHADNHYLDARVYATCAADTCGIRSLAIEAAEPEKKKPEKKEKRESWLSGYGK